MPITNDDTAAAAPVVLLMRRRLTGSVTPPVWPAGIYLSHFNDADARPIYNLLTFCYKNGEGFLPHFDEWLTSLVNDEEFDASLCFVLHDTDGIIGVAQCWTSGFIKDFAIHPSRQRQGLGGMLLAHVFATFKPMGMAWVELKVHEDNLPAVGLYLRSGMEVSENF